MFPATKKIVSAILFSLLLFFQATPTGWGISASSSMGDADIDIQQNDPDINDIMTNIEERYHLNKEEIQHYGEGMNVANEKKTVPELTLFFSPTSPVPGEDITATANPVYFNSDKEHLYFTWFLQHKECTKDSTDAAVKKFCDLDEDGDIDKNDWKIAAMRTIANGGFDWQSGKYNEPSYTEDRDGFDTQNMFGGDQGYKKGSNAYCYAQDPETGAIYELATPGAPSGDPNNPTPRSATSDCNHYFPHPKSGISEVGDGSFDRDEEKFWHTDPYDPDTAGLGHPDEANVVGLGKSSFTWKYAVGDKVGVMVEGISSIPAKHDDSSYAIMWAMPKKNCSVSPTGKYIEKIKGYDVEFLTGNQDLDDCIDKNLIDPREGGQTERIRAALAYSPKFISNDASGEAFGDTATITSSIENTEAKQSTIKYEWTVFVNANGSYDPRGFSTDPNLDTTDGGTNKEASKWIDITRFLNINEFINRYTGNGIVSLPITFNITSDLFKNYTGKKNPSDTKDPNTDSIKKLRVYQKDRIEGGVVKTDTSSIFGGKINSPANIEDKIGTAYFKINVKITENVDITGINAIEGGKRSSSASIVIPVSRMGDNQMIVKKVDVNANNKLVIKKGKAAPTSPLTDIVICNENAKPNGTTPDNYLGIGRNLCLVVKNEIFNLSIANDDNSLKNFQWTLDGEPLLCTSDMAETSSAPIKPLCSDSEEGSLTFLPVTGDAGKVYDVNVSALDSVTGKRISVSRAFQVIDPYATIASQDKDKVWQKYLGYYKKTDSDGKIYAYENLSTTKFQAFPETVASFKVTFPSGIGDRAKYEWVVDGTKISDSTKQTDPDKIQILLSGDPGTTHTITVNGYITEKGRFRNILSKFWNASVFDTEEQSFSNTIEVEIVPKEEESALASPTSFFAAIAKNAPRQILFVFELFLSVFVMIILLSLIFSIGTREK